MREQLQADANSIIVGHSSGAEAAMRFAETYKASCVCVCVCVCGWVGAACSLYVLMFTLRIGEGAGARGGLLH